MFIAYLDMCEPRDATARQVRGVHKALSVCSQISLLRFYIAVFSFSTFPLPVFVSAVVCVANAALLFCFFLFPSVARDEKVLGLLRSWIKRMNMTKSLVTSVSL